MVTSAAFSTSFFMVQFLLRVLELIHHDLPRQAQNQTSSIFLIIKVQKLFPLAVTVVFNRSAVPAFSRETTTQRSVRASCVHIFWHEICASTACLPLLTTSVCVRSPIPKTSLGLQKIDLRDYSRIKRGGNKKKTCETTSTFPFRFGM